MEKGWIRQNYETLLIEKLYNSKNRRMGDEGMRGFGDDKMMLR